MVQGRLRAVVCTSTLDLGIDWGEVDFVINVGAAKGASRLAPLGAPTLITRSTSPQSMPRSSVEVQTTARSWP